MEYYYEIKYFKPDTQAGIPQEKTGCNVVAQRASDYG
jgi:hypothetical protein